MNLNLRADLRLLASNINKTRWTEPNNKKVLPMENYFAILTNQPFKYCATANGHNSKFNYDISATYFYGENPDCALALVSSQKVTRRIGGEELLPFGYASMSVASYIVDDGKVVIINRFDPRGHSHFNKFDFIVDPVEQELAKLFFKESATCPHFHFNTRTQSLNLRTADDANAISISDLICYVNAILREKDMTRPILQYDFGMPFLAFRMGRLKYQSKCFDIVQDFANNSQLDNNVKYFLKSLIYHEKANEQSVSLGEENARSLIADLKLVRDVTEFLPENEQIIMALSQELLRAISGGIGDENTKEIDPIPYKFADNNGGDRENF